jgi:hypothetical protein
VERCKKCIACQGEGGTSKTRPSPHLPKVATRSNKVSPRTLQTAVVHSSNLILYAKYVKLTLNGEVISVHPIFYL